MINKLNVSKWFVKTAILTPVLGCAIFASSVTADVLYEDIYFWGSDNQVDASVMVQETVYNNEQGSAILERALDAGWVSGQLDIVGDINLYVYSVTNLQADEDITEFNIQSTIKVGASVFAPTSGFGAWNGSYTPGDGFAWDIVDQTGIPVGWTHSGFMVAVAAGTEHSTEAIADVGGISGLVSAPIPEPSTWALVGIGSIAMLALRRHRS